jgi:nucleoside-diphosphate-sugar epimerase
VSRRTLIVGCGYVGRALARALRERGDIVTGWVRSESSATDIGRDVAETIVGSVADDACWRGLGPFDAVIHCAASRGGGPEAYREVYLEGVRQVNARMPGTRHVFVSSTSVYGQTDGAWVDESAATKPEAKTSRILVEAECEALVGGASVVRSAGIYGPGRAALFEKFRRGEAVMEGAGGRWVNQVHRDDLVGAIMLMLEKASPREVYNAADNEPVRLFDFYVWCATRLRLPMPPSGAADPNRKRGLTNKRVANGKLRTLGWSPRFPTFREGLQDLLAADHSPR